MHRPLRLRVLRRLTAVLAVAVMALVAGCTGGTDAVDTNANGQFRYVGATKRGTLIDAPKRKLAGDVHADYLKGSGTGRFKLSQAKGKVVVLNYWATWCPPCVVETPALDKLYRSIKAGGVEFVGIGVKDTDSHLSAFVRDNAISYPMLSDPNAKTALQLGRIPTFSLPSTVIIDRQGRVAAVYVGPVLDGDLQPVLSTLSAEK